MKKKRILRILAVAVTTSVIFGCANLKVQATSYVYDYWKNIVPSTEGITYKETYYNKDIKYASDTSKSLPTFNNLSDMEVYDGQIFVIDQYNSTSTSVSFEALKSESNPTGTVGISGVSKLYVLDQNFYCVKELNEFLITDEVREKFDQFYQFNTPLDEITDSEYNSSEFIDIYSAERETGTIVGNTAKINTLTYDVNSFNGRDSLLDVYYEGTQLQYFSDFEVANVSELSYTSNNANYSYSKVIKLLQDAGINVVHAYSDNLISIRNSYTVTKGIKNETLTLTNSNVNSSVKVIAVPHDANTANKQMYNDVKAHLAVTVGSELGAYMHYYGYDMSSELGIKKIETPFYLSNSQYSISGNTVSISADTLATFADGTYDLYIECSDAEYSNKIYVANEDAEAAKTLLSKVNPTVETGNYIFFNRMADNTNVNVVQRTLSICGRAPYIAYSKDSTKAAVRLNNASGVTATSDAIYIADTSNARILKLNYDYEVIDVYLTPEDSEFYQMARSLDYAYETEYGWAYEVDSANNVTNMYSSFASTNVFNPKKIAISISGVCYCIAANIYEGLIEFSTDTTFNRYLGKNTVTQDALKKVWANIWSETQYASQALDLPAMFNNLAISDDGFLYATSDPDADATTPTNLVKVINTKGVDIMKRTGYVTPDGDAVYLAASTETNAIIGSSTLTAVAISKTGNFTVTDSKRGRLFTYDSEGNLLYITGEQPGGTSSAAIGGLSSSILNPVAVDYLYRTNTLGEEEETVIVLDQLSNSIILYETTEFGEAVNKATYLYQNGVITDTYETDEDGNYVLDENGDKILVSQGAESYWRQVIKMNTNYELAYLGIGKALNRRGEYQEAMKYFKLAHNATYYSKAYSSYRDAVLSENFSLMMTVIILIVAGVVASKVIKGVQNKNNKRGKEED